MSETRTENDSVIQIAQEAARAQAGPVLVVPGNMYAFPTAEGVELLDLDTGVFRDRLPAPRRKTGHVTVEDVDSFFAYYNKHADDGTEVYVNVDTQQIVAVLNAHQGDGPRYGDHQLTLRLKTTKAWKDWTGQDRKPMNQQMFAEFVEDHLSDIREPSAADMLEVAQTFQAKTKVNFASSSPLASGDRRLVFEETTDASAGSKGQLEVPSVFKIAVKCLELPTAEGEDPTVYGIDARFRYRINGGQLTVLFLLDDTAAVLRDAVLAVVGQIETGLGVPVLRGTPA